MPDTSILKIDDLSFTYGKSGIALDHISLEVASGESLVILGANGSGKSTLLKIMAGLLFSTQGTYFALGKIISEKLLSHDIFGITFRKEVGILFQNVDVQLFNTSVEDELAFGPRQLGLPDTEIIKRVHHTLQAFGLESLAMRPPYALSGGEKKRVAIASVTIMDPTILLLDEPTSSLDPRSAHELIGRLRTLRESGRTLVIATHDIHLVPEIATRVVVLGENRRLIADGTPKDILTNRDLLASANLIHRHHHSHDGIWHSHEHEHDPETH